MKIAAAPLVVVLAMGLVGSVSVDAQVRVRGSARVGPPRARAVVVVGGYRRPFYRPFYDPFYRPFYDPFYFNTFYGPYYRPFYWYPAAEYGGAYGAYDDASLRVQVTPHETEVYIDSYYAGTVDDFDGIFQRLHLESGSHDITLYLDGYRAVHQRIYLQPTGTFRLRYSMQPLGAGEIGEPRPSEPPPPPQGQARPDAGTAGPRPGGPGRYPPPPQRGGPPPRVEARPQGPPLQGVRSESGTLSVRVQPANAEVFIDGERWDGPSGDERLIVEVSPGLHHVEVRRDGYRSYQSDIDVRPGDTSNVNISLSRQ